MAESHEKYAVWREGDVAVVRRDCALPPLCLLSGESATRTVRCYFHRQERPLFQASVLGLIRHYLYDVRKATLDLPMSDRLLRRRRIGWAFFGLAAALAIGTVAGLVLAQMLISQMPAGARRRWWNDLGVPIIALGGFLLTALAALGSYKVMPMPTKALRAIRIDDTRVWLAGAFPAYLDRISEVGDH